MNNQRYRNENATPRERISLKMMNTVNAGEKMPETENHEAFEGTYPLAMAYVPEQKWGEVYSLEAGFPKGTIFPSLDFPLVGCGKVRRIR